MEKKRFDELMKSGSKAEIRAEVESLVIAQNELFLANKLAEAYADDSSIEELVNRYTNLARTECFSELLACDDPMKEAVLRLTFLTIRVQESEDKDTHVKSRKVVDVAKDIDLTALHKKAEGGIGADKLWIHKLQKLNYCLAISVGKAIGDPKWTDPDKLKEISDSFVMSDIAKAFSLGKNPASNTQLLKSLTTIVQAMIGDTYKPTSHDVEFMKSCYAKRGKAKQVQLPNHRTYTMILRDVCNECITHSGYDVISKAVKVKK